MTDDAPPTVVPPANADSKPTPPSLAQPLTATMNNSNNMALRDLDLAQRELNLLAQQQQLLRLAAQQQQMAAFAPPFGGGGAGFPNPFEQLYAAQRGLPASFESMAFQAQQQQQHLARMNSLMGLPSSMNNPFFASNQFGAVAGLDPLFPTSTSSAAMMATPYPSAQGQVLLRDSAAARQPADIMGKRAPEKAQSSSVSRQGPIVIMKQKPKRPLSAYNIFFKEQRAKMNEELAYSEERGGEEKKEDDDDVDNAGPENDGGASSGDKRKMTTSTKSGGRKKPKVGFAILAKTIGPLWKALDAKTVQFYQAQADKEKDRYRQECLAYQRYQEREWETQQHTLESTIDDSAN
jgi:hypothetical protein